MILIRISSFLLILLIENSYGGMDLNDDVMKMLKSMEDRIRILQYRPNDCQAILNLGFKEDGVYDIYSDQSSNKAERVYCEMKGDVGWTVVLRRKKQNPQEDFNRDWMSYRNGFGDPQNEHWLGNEKILHITNSSLNRLRIDINFTQGDSIWGEWGIFKIRNEQDKYRLKISHFNLSSTMPNFMDQGYFNFYYYIFKIFRLTETFKCGKDEFKCKKWNICVPPHRVCDQINDCPDKSDEDDSNCPENCREKTRRKNRCSLTHNSTCIHFQRRCDKRVNCIGGTDELDCIDRCNMYHSGYFLCDNGQCIHSSDRCDRKFDCADHSDETHCGIMMESMTPMRGTGGFWFQKNDNKFFPTTDYNSPSFGIEHNGRVQQIKDLTIKLGHK